MARVARLEVGGGWYHVINRGHQRRAIFRDRRCYDDFLKRLSQFPQRFGIKIHTYVLMPNHYHLQMELGARPALSAAMHWLNTGYGIWFNRRFQRVGALFQGRFKAILFAPEECLLAIHYYLHLNPVRVGALKNVEKEPEAADKNQLARCREALRDYEWSSYPDYAGLRSSPSWLTLETVREQSGLTVGKYRQELDRRVTGGRLGLEWEGELAAGVLMGSRKVVGVWKRLLAKEHAGERRQEIRRFGLVTWEEVIDAVEQEWGQPWQTLRQIRGTGARAIAIWFARHRGGMTLNQVRAELDATSYSAVAMQVGRFQRELAENAVLRKRLKAVAKRLNVQC
jgi:REP element-mobilizing transposase RayT